MKLFHYRYRIGIILLLIQRMQHQQVFVLSPVERTMIIGRKQLIEMSKIATQKTQLLPDCLTGKLDGAVSFFLNVQERFTRQLSVGAGFYRAMQCGGVKNINQLFALAPCPIQQLQIGRACDVLCCNGGIYQQFAM